jgi:hypothetical protein
LIIAWEKLDFENPTENAAENAITIAATTHGEVLVNLEE